MTQVTGKDDPALSPFPVFAVLYTVAIVVELGEQWIDPWFTGGFVLVAGAAIATGMSRLKFLVLLVASTTYFLLFRFPDVANHVNLVLCLNLAIIAVLSHSLVRHRDAPDHDYTAMLPMLRIGLILVYVIAGFDKLNSDFFDPAASCAAGMLQSIIEVMQTRFLGMPLVLPLAVVLTYLGYRLLRRGRFGTAGNRAFTVAVIAIAAAGVVAVLLVLLTPRPGSLAPVIGVIAAVSVIGWELGGGLLLTVPRLQAGILAFSLTMHAALALIGFVDFGALAVALLFTFVPASHLQLLTAGRGPAAPRVRAYTAICFGIALVCGWSAHVHRILELTLLTGLAFNAAVVIAIWPLLAALFSAGRGPRWAGVCVLDKRMPAPCYVFATVLVLIGLTPYLGLRTAGNFSMFSNLRTEGESSNHLLLGSNPIKVWGYQEDVVWILEIDDRYGDVIYHYDGSPRGYALPVVEFRKWIHAWGQAGYRVPMTYAYDGYRHTTEDIVTDPAWRTADLSPEMYLLDFRYIQPGQPNYCRW
ncbi:hypothetical protein [Mycolicibacterium sp. P9-22]|uniref:hypothetical protein n=1 Tax=Mycolicibacterium sp. P9-22 TaxID=2024613 RepID=UPI0011EF006F|nr:hypothetical protein [Mycolicibacterium sp. P9-22]KAA0112833.1 hypothetical protein CIW51_26560 [Mycolicibacterium sp. P9-22]